MLAAGSRINQYLNLYSASTLVAFVVGIFKRQMIIRKLESMGHYENKTSAMIVQTQEMIVRCRTIFDVFYMCPQ